MKSTIKCCLNCTDKRHVGCHSTCKDYIKEKAEFEKMKEDCRKAKDKERMINGYKREDYEVENGK